MVKNQPANAAVVCLIPGLGRSFREANGNPLQYSFLGNPMDRRAWRGIMHGLQRVGHYLATKQQQQNTEERTFIKKQKFRSIHLYLARDSMWLFPGSSECKESACHAGDQAQSLG